jgi:hypothetical protein
MGARTERPPSARPHAREVKPLFYKKINLKKSKQPEDVSDHSDYVIIVYK